MKPTLTLDTRGFDRALREYQKATGKTVPQVVNRAAVNLAFRSAQFTPPADKFAVASGKGIRNPWAFVNYTLKKQGKKLPKNRDAYNKALAMILRKRAAAVGFIRAGWVKAGRAIKDKAGNVGSTMRPPGGVSRRLGVGRGTPAIEALNAFALIVNASDNAKSETGPKALQRYGGAGLQKAIGFVTRDMLDYARKKMAQNAARFNRAG